MRAMMFGHFDDGERLITEAAAIESAIDSVNVMVDLGIQLATLRLQQGRLAELVDAVRGLIEQYPRLVAWRAALALMLIETDQIDAARAEFDDLAECGFDGLPDDIAYLPGLTMASEVCAHLGDAARAAELLGVLRPYEDHAVTISHLAYLGPVSHFLGILETTVGNFDEASRLLDEALGMTERLGAAPFVLQTQLARAEMLLRRRVAGDADTARALLTTVEAGAVQMGMLRLVERARRSVRAAS